VGERHVLTLLWCGEDSAARGRFGPILGAARPDALHSVGPRPGKPIDPLLTGRVLVVGDDADLAAVALRLLRRDLLGTVELAYAPADPTPVTRLHRLPVGPAAVALARAGAAQEVTLVRDDVGGVLVGLGELGPIAGGTVYVDERRVLRGGAERIRVVPDPALGLIVTVEQRRVAGVFGPRPTSTRGRAVQLGMAPTTVRSDGREYPRAMDRWTYYKHTAPLRLVCPSP
jgi:hypothetical protein